MGKKLILHGVVQGVFCRNYCSKYAQRLQMRGSASNLRDGTVRVILNTNDDEKISEFIYCLKNNPYGFTFYGSIINVDISDFSGTISGDYIF